MGGGTRLRISSQSLKRSWRKSDIFETVVAAEHIGTRTKTMGVEVYNKLTKGGVEETDARQWARAIAEKFGKLKAVAKNKPTQDLEIEQLAHFSPQEEKKIFDLVERLIQTKTAPTEEDLKLVQKEHTAADIALFGRMLADNPFCNTEAAAQVAHAITVHKVAIEDDYFTAVDDLNRGEEDMGAGHVDVAEFAAGLFYLYICVDTQSLRKNLMDREDLAGRTLRGLVEAAAKVSPTGKQNSFGSRAYASYILAEKGDQQPRSLSVAFLKPVNANDMLDASIKRLQDTLDKMDYAYGPCATERKAMIVPEGKGSLSEIIQFAARP
jgi:CRISPR system Cascade subunit CasC